MKTKTILLLLAGCLLACTAYTYSHDGHYLVGAIADQMLAGTPAGAKVGELLGGVTLARAATMPDEIKDWDPTGRKHRSPFQVTTNKELNADLEAFLHANQTRPDCSGELLHHEYHFADIQVFSSPTSYSDSQVGASDHDVVHMISFCIDVLTGKRSQDNPQKITRRVALVLLVHYVGDIHQPLHVGAEYFDQNGKASDPNATTNCASDKGGNALSLVLLSLADVHNTHPGNLHHYWDENAVETATNNWGQQINPSDPRSVSLDAMAKFLKALPQGWNNEPAIQPNTFAVDFANDILPIAQEAHKKLDFNQISTKSNNGGCVQVTSGTATALASEDYPVFAGQVVADEIQKGGHRLADLLQVILH